jgi:hypothetical protein
MNPKDTIGRSSQEMLRGRISRYALFDPSRYSALNQDVRDGKQGSLEHYVKSGIWEQRPFASNTDIARVLGKISALSAEPDAPQAGFRFPQALSKVSGFGTIGVYVSSLGNFFMTEIAELLICDLRNLGLKAQLNDELASIEQRPKVCIFVAPHEFFLLGRGPEWFNDEILQTALVYNVEQTQTSWFRAGLPAILLSRGVLDLNYQSYILFAKAGIPSLFYNSGYPAEESFRYSELPNNGLVPGLSQKTRDYNINSDIWSERPNDLFFVGIRSPVRETFFARNAALFARFTCCFDLVKSPGGPLIRASSETRPAFNRYVARRSKIVLNLHQDDIRFFEWHRIVVNGLWHRALVVSTHCLPHPIFKSGTHYLEETMKRIPGLIEWLLTTPDGMQLAERIRNEAFAALVENNSSHRSAMQLVGFIADHFL